MQDLPLFRIEHVQVTFAGRQAADLDRVPQTVGEAGYKLESDDSQQNIELELRLAYTLSLHDALPI